MVYIILVNYKSCHDTLECLTSLYQLNDRQFKVIVIDNASDDGSVERISEAFPQVTIMANFDNLGFAAGNRIGIEKALQEGAAHIWLLNNDTVVQPDSLELLRHYANQYEVALLSGKIYKYGTDREIWFCGADINWRKGKPFHIHMHEKDKQMLSEPYTSLWLSGCCMFAKAKVFFQYPMDERYFLYFEDVDYCMRLNRKGIPLLVVPQAVIWHKKSASVSNNAHIQAYYSVRNNLYFMEKYAKIKYKIRYYPYFIIRSLLFSIRHLVRGFIKRNSSLVRLGNAYWQGVVDYFMRKQGKSSSIS
ncbi:MAG TPA: glycosyltransferase family 2 protein [Methylomusa anaerophila]|uniref:N-acetylglucosaminyl-diphospho-decaprenol L-rhamnosyltransferase n=1 Tax=Methylomusa anaerophila TaxID=1930071 RepID=A0A348AKL5_9FIRM|nr:glycosyltransferase family 2 protein [Methylomusa anaerophila]BBB91613.1 N-acetylglucosaminyl-diphospho-decaprenol L-rhamnosyltransferase [Methylomusa anaerophila]HML89449.1 glycosyltransferase family 2 protein [Methylomusa anaerophila]